MQKPRFGKELFVGRSVGSVCSGIEAASVAWVPLGFEFSWFSEIADFPSKLLAASPISRCSEFGEHERHSRANCG